MQNLPKYFDWKFYLESNPDLQKANLKSESDAVTHYLKYGQYEKRQYCAHSQEFFYEKYKHLSFLKNKKRIIFVNHNESLTGAPFLLKDIIRYEQQKNELDIWVISLTPGNDDSWEEFNTIHHWIIPGKTDADKYKFIDNLLSPDLVYANTIASMNFALQFKCKKIISIHENRELIQYGDSLSNLKHFDKVLVACRPAIDILARFGISCELYPYFLNKDKNDYFVNLSIDKKSPIVCAGVAEFRKGIHRFIEIAASLPNEKFVWVGSTSHISIENNKVSFTADNFRTIDYEIGQRIANRRITLEIPKNVEFMGLVKDPNMMRQIFSNAKCLLMLSTDDPFPLVVIEAKLLNKNVVNLKESGDSYTVCDSADLILEKYDRTPIINYLKGLSPNPVKFNEELYNKLQSNSEINRNVYLSLIGAN